MNSPSTISDPTTPVNQTTTSGQTSSTDVGVCSSAPCPQTNSGNQSSLGSQRKVIAVVIPAAIGVILSAFFLAFIILRRRKRLRRKKLIEAAFQVGVAQCKSLQRQPAKRPASLLARKSPNIFPSLPFGVNLRNRLQSSR